MRDADNTGDEEDKDEKSRSENETEGATGADDTKDKNDGADDGKGTDDGDNDDSDGDGADDKGGGEDKGDDKKKPADKKPTQDDDEPPRRKSTIDHILARKNAKIAKLKDKDGGAKDDDSDDDDGIAPEDADVIDRRVKKILSPFIDKQVAEENKQEADTFVTENPHFKPYLAKVLKWAQHPTRQNIPISSLFYEVAGKDLLKIGAEMGKKADDKARETNAGGGNNRGSGSGTKPVWDMSAEEFEAEQANTRNKQTE